MAFPVHDWNSVDWRMTNRVIADILGCRLETVCARRSRVGAPPYLVIRKECAECTVLFAPTPGTGQKYCSNKCFRAGTYTYVKTGPHYHPIYVVSFYCRGCSRWTSKKIAPNAIPDCQYCTITCFRKSDGNSRGKEIVDWRSVNWKQSNKTIAGQLGLCVGTIYSARKRRGIKKFSVHGGTSLVSFFCRDCGQWVSKGTGGAAIGAYSKSGRCVLPGCKATCPCGKKYGPHVGNAGYCSVNCRVVTNRNILKWRFGKETITRILPVLVAINAINRWNKYKHKEKRE